MNITCVISSLGCGGAERVLTHLLNYWAYDDEDQITLLTLSCSSDFFAVPKNIKRVNLDLSADSTHVFAACFNNLRRLVMLRRLIKKTQPEVVISFIDITNILCLLSLKGTGIPVIVSERNHLFRDNLAQSWRYLRRLTYPWASSLVTQNQSIAEDAKSLKLNRQIHVIPNPLDFSSLSPHTIVRDPNQIVALGSLSHQKGFDLLLEAFARIRTRFPKARLTIYGEGPLRGALEEHIKQLRLTKQVRLPGQTSTAQGVLQGAGIFVLSSRFEGSPNVLAEAMACGCACISYNCPHGPSELIKHNQTGLLVSQGNIASLEAAMLALLKNPRYANELGQLAQEDMQRRFDLPTIATAWKKILP